MDAILSFKPLRSKKEAIMQLRTILPIKILILDETLQQVTYK